MSAPSSTSAGDDVVTEPSVVVGVSPLVPVVLTLSTCKMRSNENCYLKIAFMEAREIRVDCGKLEAVVHILRNDAREKLGATIRGLKRFYILFRVIII